MKLAQPRQGISPAALVALASGNMKNFMAATMEGGIEAQEKAGQLEQAQRNTLPINLGQRYGGSVADARKPWESLGFKFSKKTVDEIFIEVEFPKGWKKVPTDHSMWSKIVDDKGRERGSIFYKAAFYDRSAYAHLERRFGVSQDYGKPTVTVSVSDACKEVEFKVGGLVSPNWENREEARKLDGKIQEARTLCETYLKNNFPDYDSPMAYWA